MHRQWINNQLVIVDCRVGQLRGRLPPIAHIPHRAKPLAVVEFDANESPELISVDKVKAALDGEWSSSYSIEGNYVRAIDGSVFTLKYRSEEKFVIECERFGRGTVDQTLVRLEWDNGDVWDRVPHCLVNSVPMLA